MTTGTTSRPTWALEEIAISLASRIFPLCAMTIAPPCSAALPTIATITTAMKNSLRPTAVAKASSEWTRISLTQAVAPVATASAASAAGSDHAPVAGSSRSRCSGGGAGSGRRPRDRASRSTIATGTEATTTAWRSGGPV